MLRRLTLSPASAAVRMCSMTSVFVRGDFNGACGDLLCLTHSDCCWGENGESIPVFAGMNVVAFDNDCDDEGRDNFLIAEGVVEQSPRELACRGSKWALRINERGIRRERSLHQSDTAAESGG